MKNARDPLVVVIEVLGIGIQRCDEANLVDNLSSLEKFEGWEEDCSRAGCVDYVLEGEHTASNVQTKRHFVRRRRGDWIGLEVVRRLFGILFLEYGTG